ncbi:MAG: hypothetical protein QM541_05245 [Flavobacterium sp.]|nr:hypothetical protein [Flavobacterium sp.]
MRKLNKTLALATIYQGWHNDLEENNENHPAYNSANGEFYVDIVANLLWVQDGLCAYSEQFLYDKAELVAENWAEGRYAKGKFEFYGNLEHYDESLKGNKAWLWSNLFVVQTDINNKKGTKPVMYALKPDADDYNPFSLLEYDFVEHKFLPNRNINFAEQARILHDINVLGLNFKPLTQVRRDVINTLIEEIQLKKKSLQEARASLREYFTAFEMTISNLNIV